VDDVQFKPKLIARSTLKIENSATNEKVITETIGTATADYVRYVEISSKNSPQALKTIVGQWASHDVAKNEQPQVLTQALIGSLLMFGNLNASQRKDIIGQLQTTKAFQKYDFVGKKTVGGRTIDTFNVTIDLVSYSKVYANYLRIIGQESLASQLGQQQPGDVLNFLLDIDANSRVPSQITFKDDGGSESYSNVGSGPRITTPKATLTVAELQAKLSGK
jgi:acyl-CoA hydrolase